MGIETVEYTYAALPLLYHGPDKAHVQYLHNLMDAMKAALVRTPLCFLQEHLRYDRRLHLNAVVLVRYSRIVGLLLEGAGTTVSHGLLQSLYGYFSFAMPCGM